jgi:hypothetical protein
MDCSLTMAKGGGAGVYFFKEFIKKCTRLKFDVLKIVTPPKKKSREKNVPPPTIFSWSQAARACSRFWIYQNNLF